MDLKGAIYDRSPWWLQNLFLNAHALRVEHHRYGRKMAAVLRQLREQESWAGDKIRAYQDDKLRRIVRLAFEETEYYREVMLSVGLRPADIASVADLPKLPLLEREAVRSRGGELLTRDPASNWLEGHTSGTTGAGLTIWYDRWMCIMNNAVDRRHKAWAGMENRDWIGLLLGQVIVPPSRHEPPFWRVNHVQKEVWFSSFHLTEENLPSYAGEIRRRSLEFLEGYPSTLFILAKYLVDRGQTLPLQAAITSSETLHRIQRETIEAAFECKVWDFYAMAERVIHAGECREHEGKHLSEEYGIVEIVNEGGEPVPDGDYGYLVGTSLHNTAMPMLRYRMNDVSRILVEPCACGRAHRRISSVSTKAEDIVVTPAGRWISPSVLTHPFKPFDQIKKSQVIQERPDSLLVKVVCGGDFSAEDESRLRTKLQERVGKEMKIEIVRCDEIPREASGKFRWVISKLDHQHQVDWSSVQS